MVQRLHLTMEVVEKADGTFEARCPELSVSASGRFAEEAIDLLKGQVFSSMAGGFDSVNLKGRTTDPLQAILDENNHCYLCFPSNPQVH